MIDKLMKHGFMHFLVHATYLTGIALLFPIAVKSLEINVPMWKLAETNFMVSIALILIGIVILWKTKDTFAKTMKSLGFTTFLPGFFFLIITIIGKNKITGGSQQITGLSVAPKVLDYYLSHGVPEIAIIASMYLSAGFLLYWVGTKLERMETIH